MKRVEPANSAVSKRHIMAVSLLSILSLLAYFNTFGNSFQYDDSFVVGQTPRSIGNFIDLRSYNSWMEALFDLKNRPVLKRVFATNYYYCKDAVFGYHLANTAIHIMVSIGLFSLFHALLKNSSDAFERVGRFRLALSAAVFLALSPMATEGVTYIMGRSSSLATLFYALSVLFFFMGYKRAFPGSILSLSCALFFFVIGIGAKEIVITAPAAAILSLYLLRTGSRSASLKRALLSLLLPLGLIGGYILFRGGVGVPDTAIESFKMGGEANPHVRYLITQLNVIPYQYLRLLFFPFNQNIDPDFPRSIPFLCLRTLSGVFIIMSLISWAFSRNRFSVFSFAVLWFFLALLPTSSIIPLSDPATEHRAYLPSIGFFVAVALLAGRLRLAGHWRVLLVLMPLFFSAGTIARNRVWMNGCSLWSDAARKSPDKPRPFNNLGGSLFREKNDFNGAVRQFEKAIQLDPRFLDAHKNLASTYYESGRMDEAVKKFEHVYFLDPKSRPWASGFLGDSYMRKGVFSKAAEYFTEAIRSGADEAYYHLRLGLAYKMLGDLKKAKDAYNSGLALEPKSHHLKFNLAEIYMLEGKFEESEKLYLETLNLRPDFVEAMLNLGFSYRKMGKFELALSWLRKAMGMDPNSEKAHVHLGLLYKDMGKAGLALEELNHALRLNPSSHVTLNLIGSVYFSESDYGNAKNAFRRALETSPDFQEARHNLEAAEMAEKRQREGEGEFRERAE